MAIIYTYPTKTTPSNNDLLIITDSEDENKTKQVRISDLPSGGASSGVSSITLTTGASNGTPLTITPSGGTGTVNLTSRSYGGGSDVGYVPSGGTNADFLRGDGTWDTPVGTSYTAGNGLELTGTSFSADLKPNGGIVFDNAELAVDLSATAITGSLGVAQGGTGKTTFATGFVKASGTNPFAIVGLINMSSEVTGTLGVGNGGTGLSSYSPGDILYYNGATANLKKLSMGSAQVGKVLMAGGTAPNFIPVWGEAGTGTVTSVGAASPLQLESNSTATAPVIGIGQIPLSGHIGDAGAQSYKWLNGDGVNGTWTSPGRTDPLPITLANTEIPAAPGGMTNKLFMYTFVATATHSSANVVLLHTGNATQKLRIGLYAGGLTQQGALMRSTVATGVNTSTGIITIPLNNVPSQQAGGQKFIEAGETYTIAFHSNVPSTGTKFAGFNGLGNVYLSATSTLASVSELPANLPTQLNLTTEPNRICCYITD